MIIWEMGCIMHEEYLKENLEAMYKIAVSDFKCARDEEEQWRFRAELARIERMMAENYGFAECDRIHKKYWG